MCIEDKVLELRVAQLGLDKDKIIALYKLFF